MPVEFSKPDSSIVQFKFTRGTAHNGIDYYPGDVAELDSVSARTYALQNRGSAVVDEPVDDIEENDDDTDENEDADDESDDAGTDGNDEAGDSDEAPKPKRGRKKRNA